MHEEKWSCRVCSRHGLYLLNGTVTIRDSKFYVLLSVLYVLPEGRGDKEKICCNGRRSRTSSTRSSRGMVCLHTGRNQRDSTYLRAKDRRMSKKKKMQDVGRTGFRRTCGRSWYSTKPRKLFLDVSCCKSALLRFYLPIWPGTCHLA